MPIVKRNKNVCYWGFSRRITGLGLWIDFIPPIAVRDKSFSLNLDLLWFRFWWIRYKDDPRLNAFYLQAIKIIGWLYSLHL